MEPPVSSLHMELSWMCIKSKRVMEEFSGMYTLLFSLLMTTWINKVLIKFKKFQSNHLSEKKIVISFHCD